MRLSDYFTIVFDCDGVLLDSNKIKTAAFRDVALPFGEAAAEALVKYHIANGGISRFCKFQYFLENILGEAQSTERVSEFARQYGERVYQGLLSCPITPGLAELRRATEGIGWMIVSGGAEEELRQVFSVRGLAQWFDWGVFGSPASKDEILAGLRASGRLPLPALFIGDSRYDHEASSRAGLDFVFASAWTEFSGWAKYCAEHQIHTVSAAADLLHSDFFLSDIL